MKVLLIEDEVDFVARLQKHATTLKEVELVTPDDVGLAVVFGSKDDMPLEEQLGLHLKEIVTKHGIDLILLDTDLSQNQRLRSQTDYRNALAEIGVPTLRYRKRPDRGREGIVAFVRKLAKDGASAIMVPYELVIGEGPEKTLFPWLIEIDKGFAAIHEAMKTHPEYVKAGEGEKAGDGPAGLLARILERSELHSDLLGYTAPNAYFFAEPSLAMDTVESAMYALSTRLGYWLVNYILAFPGPLLPPAAAAAVLNVTMDAFARDDVQKIIEPARYHGPFSGLKDGFYWRQDLSDLVMDAGGDIAERLPKGAPELERVDPSPYGQAFYCLVSGKPIAAADTAISPDWIPPGASMTRISQEEIDDLGPMLNI